MHEFMMKRYPDTPIRALVALYRRLFRALSVAILIGYGIGLNACGSADVMTEPVTTDPAAAYWTLQLNYRAITLSTQAPWDTVTLVPIPLTYRGDTIGGDGIISTFQSSDSNNVSVTPTGYIRAKKVTSSTQITVRLTVGTITYVDTAFVRVVDNSAPQTLHTLSIQPTPPDSAKVAVTEWFFSLEPFLKRTSVEGVEMTEILVNYQSENPVLLRIDSQYGELLLDPFTLIRVAAVKIVASAYAYGISRSDTLTMRMGYPLWVNGSIKKRPMLDGVSFETYVDAGNPVTLGVGGIFSLVTDQKDDFTMIWDDTANIEVIDGGAPGASINRVLYGYDNPEYTSRMSTVQLRFTAPGDYSFHDPNTGVIGRIRVINER